jgi:hypothetical protein
MSERRRAKQDRRARRKSTSRVSGYAAFERLLAALEARGQTVHRLSPGYALTLCPNCLAEGRRSLLEIRFQPGDGVKVEDCDGGGS